MALYAVHVYTPLAFLDTAGMTKNPWALMATPPCSHWTVGGGSPYTEQVRLRGVPSIVVMLAGATVKIGGTVRWRSGDVRVERVYVGREGVEV